MAMHTTDSSKTAAQKHVTLLRLLAPYLNGDAETHVRQNTLALSENRLGTLPPEEWARLDAGDPLSADGTDALSLLLLRVFGGHPRDADPDHAAAVERDLEPVTLFGHIFADVAAVVPAPAPLVLTAANRAAYLVRGGQLGLVALCQTLPQVSEERARRLLGTPSLQAVATQNPSLANALALAGLTPVEFRDASRAVTDTILRGLVDGPNQRARVVLGIDGHFADGWPGAPTDALRDIAEATELPLHSAQAVLQWLVAAAEVAPEASLFPMLRTAGVKGGIAITIAPGPHADDSDDANDLWRTFLEAAETVDDAPDSHGGDRASGDAWAEASRHEIANSPPRTSHA